LFLNLCADFRLEVRQVGELLSQRRQLLTQGFNLRLEGGNRGLIRCRRCGRVGVLGAGRAGNDDCREQAEPEFPANPATAQEDGGPARE
jgi:hypothetical protein